MVRIMMINNLSVLSDNLQASLNAYLNPSGAHVLRLKFLFALPLSPDEIRQALKSPHSSPVKNWLLEIIFSLIRYISNRDEIALRQLFRLRRKSKKEDKILSLKLEKIKSHRRARAFLSRISLAAAEVLLEEVKENKKSCFQIIQETKLAELKFWVSLVKDEHQLAKVITAVEKRYEIYAENEASIAKIENELKNENLSDNERQHKEALVESFQTHIKLSAPEMLAKHIPDFYDPDKVVHVAQTLAVHEEMISRIINQEVNIKEKTRNKIFDNAKISSSITFLHYIPETQSYNKWNRLALQLGAAYNKYREAVETNSRENDLGISKLLDCLNEHKKAPSESLERAIYLEVQNSIDMLTASPSSGLSEVLKCLENWKSKQLNDFDFFRNSRFESAQKSEKNQNKLYDNLSSLINNFEFEDDISLGL